MAQLLHIQIDEHLQRNAMTVLHRNGISIDDFVWRILNRLSEDNSFIYDIDIPNELMADTLKKKQGSVGNFLPTPDEFSKIESVLL